MFIFVYGILVKQPISLVARFHFVVEFICTTLQVVWRFYTFLLVSLQFYAVELIMWATLSMLNRYLGQYVASFVYFSYCNLRSMLHFISTVGESKINSHIYVHLLMQGARLVYKTFATLYFVFVFDASENELAILDLMQGT